MPTTIEASFSEREEPEYLKIALQQNTITLSPESFRKTNIVNEIRKGFRTDFSLSPLNVILFCCFSLNAFLIFASSQSILFWSVPCSHVRAARASESFPEIFQNQGSLNTSIRNQFLPWHLKLYHYFIFTCTYY